MTKNTQNQSCQAILVQSSLIEFVTTLQEYGSSCARFSKIILRVISDIKFFLSSRASSNESSETSSEAHIDEYSKLLI